MPIIIAIVGICAGLIFWVLRAHRTIQHLNEVDRDTKGLQRRARSALEDLVGTPIERVRDVRLAAIILMIQLVRTGSPITASEKTRILEFMETPLAIGSISAAFERAWVYTQARLPFAQVADPLIPLLRRQLTMAERAELIDMLTQVAGAHAPPSDLQRKAIARLKRHLLADTPRVVADRGRAVG